MESNGIDRDDATAQLAALQADRAALADRVVQPWVAICLVVLVPAFVLADGYDRHWAMVVAGAVLGVAVAVLSRWWGRTWAAELRGER